MFDKKNQSNQTNKDENATSSAYPKDSTKSNADHAHKGCGCGCKHTAPADEEVVEITEESWDY